MLTTENSSSVLYNLFLLDMSICNNLVIKNNTVKKVKSFFVFKEGVSLHHKQVLVLEDRNFRCKVFSRLYRNSKFNILENLNLVFSISYKKLK